MRSWCTYWNNKRVLCNGWTWVHELKSSHDMRITFVWVCGNEFVSDINHIRKSILQKHQTSCMFNVRRFATKIESTCNSYIMKADTIIISVALIDLMGQNLRMYEIVYFGHCHSIYWFVSTPIRRPKVYRKRESEKLWALNTNSTGFHSNFFAVTMNLNRSLRKLKSISSNYIIKLPFASLFVRMEKRMLRNVFPR